MGKVGTGEEGISYGSTVSCTRVCWLYKHESRPASINLVQKSHHEERELLSSYSIGTTSDHWGVGFADAIIELLADPDRRRTISDANRALARRRFDRAVFRREVAELYRRHGHPSR